MARTFVSKIVVAALDPGSARIIRVYDMEWDSYITNTSGTWLWKWPKTPSNSCIWNGTASCSTSLDILVVQILGNCYIDLYNQHQDSVSGKPLGDFEAETPRGAAGSLRAQNAGSRDVMFCLLRYVLFFVCHWYPHTLQYIFIYTII